MRIYYIYLECAARSVEMCTKLTCALPQIWTQPKLFFSIQQLSSLRFELYFDSFFQNSVHPHSWFKKYSIPGVKMKHLTRGSKEFLSPHGRSVPLWETRRLQIPADAKGLCGLRHIRTGIRLYWYAPRACTWHRRLFIYCSRQSWRVN